MAEQQAPQPHANPGRDVFISYASHDKGVADAVCEALEGAGVACWIAPRNVTPGDFYADSIVRALDASRLIVVILSEHSVASPHVVREVERASAKRHAVISLRLDSAPLPPGLEYFLNTCQWLDASGTAARSALPQLIHAVRRQLLSPTNSTSTLGADTASAAGSVSPGFGGRSRAIPRWKGAAIALGVVAVGLVYLAVTRHWLSASTRTAQPAVGTAAQPLPVTSPVSDKSVAVLPFADMSEKHDQEYFADGMTEELIDLLTQVPGLHVPARTSSFFFKGKDAKLPDIARELHVANVIEGSIRRSGKHIRITAQLVRVDTGYHVWSETYDRELHDIFTVQDDIAKAIIQAFQITLMGGSITRQKGGTQNLEAYQLYLRARKLDDLGTVKDRLIARGLTEQAIKLDPDYALAQTSLGFLMTELATSRALPAKDGFEGARRLANHVLQVSPDVYDAHLLLAYIHRTYDFDWAAAQAEVHRALELDPNNPDVLLTASQVSATLGEWTDAERQVRAALVRDPLDAVIQQNFAKTLYRSGRYREAEAAYRKLIELSPEYPLAHAYLGKVLLAEGRPNEALAAAQQEAVDGDRMILLPVFLLAVGRRAESDAALRVLSERFAASDAYFIALNNAYRNDHDLAIQWLARAYEQRDSGFVEFVGEPLFRNLADDPRFKAFLRKMKLPG
jgi:TolB-like protein/Flp pilus assembly protein TadD